MADHYSDYLKKSVSVSDLVFDKVKESDKEVIKRIRSRLPTWASSCILHTGSSTMATLCSSISEVSK